MLVLALDTSSAAVSATVAEVDADGVAERASHRAVNARGHGELLAPLIERCLHDSKARPADLGAVVAGTGPGPFTGLRVGLVTAAVLADTLGIPAYAVCSLDAIATAVAGAVPAVLVVTDARRKEVYWARYDAAGARLTGPDVSRPDAVPLDGATAVAGAGARLYRDQLAGPALLDHDYPAPADLVRRAHARILAGAAADSLTPLSLRRPDAVVPGAPKPVTP